MLKLSATKLDRMSLVAMQDASDVREEEKTFPNGNQAKYFYLHVRNAGNEFNPYGAAFIKYEDDFRVAEMLLKSKNERTKEIDYYSR